MSSYCLSNGPDLKYMVKTIFSMFLEKLFAVKTFTYFSTINNFLLVSV